MTPQQIADAAASRFPQKILAAHLSDSHPRIHIGADDWRNIAEFLHHGAAIQLDWLQNLSGID